MNSLPPKVLQSAGPASKRHSASFATLPRDGEASSPGSDLRPQISGLRSSGAQRPTAIRHPLSVLGRRPSAISSPLSVLRRAAAFTLVELLVVISIIAILAALAIPAVSGAIESARRSEVRSMADQIKKAVSTYYAEYGVFPANVTITDAAFVTMMTTNSAQNRRGIRLLEIPAKFSSDQGLVTPPRFYSQGQTNFTVVVDSDYNGEIVAPDGTTVNASVAVGVPDPKNPENWLGTWK